MESFKELTLPPFLQESLQKMNFDKPTPVQALAIPAALEGKDLIASAETGSGKTAAFGIPLLTFLTHNTSKTALILTPTRELAEQVSEVIGQLSGGRHDLRFALLIGGVGMDKQVDAIRKGARLFIGTPGRINDHIGQQTLNLSRMGFLVLDEADRMLDMGFAPQLDRMRKWMTAPRQTMLFSATIPPDIEKMAALYLKDPIRVTVGTNSRPVERIKQEVLKTTQSRKYDNLVSEIKRREGTILVFARTQHGVDQLAQKLKGQNTDVTQIHGGMEQEQRRAALDAFKSGQARVLVATDVAARGLDVPNISHVINYDLPYEPEDYIHRIGRTGRAGAEGEALTFLTPEDHELWAAVLKKLGPSQTPMEAVRGQAEGRERVPAASMPRVSSERPNRPGEAGRQVQHAPSGSERHAGAGKGRYEGHKSAPSGPSRDHHDRHNRYEKHDRPDRNDHRDKHDSHDRHDSHNRYDRADRYSSNSHRDSSVLGKVKHWFRKMLG